MAVSVEAILEGLNDKQREAVIATDGAYLVLAGAGSGKTRVITHRFAYLLRSKDIASQNIVAVTFTNKAANEMKNRIQKLVGIPSHSLWIRTFHSMAYRVLREHAPLLGYQKNWEAVDEGDSLKILRRVIKEGPREFQEFANVYKPERIFASICSNKDKMRSPEYAEFSSLRQNNLRERDVFRGIYATYQRELQQHQVMDFGDLMLNEYLLFTNFPEVLSYYQNLWQYIMVDEFQDTNEVQYAVVSLLAHSHRNILIVGDDDQSIYGWRGARVENMKRFVSDFDAQIIKLEQNYRSTAKIITAANAVASEITSRIGKTLWTANAEGEPLVIFYGEDELAVHERIAQEIKELQQKGYTLQDMAILYRINAQSHDIEDVLIRHDIPYHIVGSVRFFERAEIKDVLAYVAFILNPFHRLALERLVRVPSRGIGETTIQNVVAFAGDKGIDLLEAMRRADEFLGKSERARVLQDLADFLSEMRDQISTMPASVFLRTLVEKVGFQEYWTLEKEEERVENIRALVDAARSFEEMNEDTSIESFFNYVILNTTEEREDNSDHVTLMTIHNAKGLEFRVVFLLGVVDGLIPLGRASTMAELDEERRLFYVALTRAKERLFLAVPKSIFQYGDSKSTFASPFLANIPVECCKEEILSPKVKHSLYDRSYASRDTDSFFAKSRESDFKRSKESQSSTPATLDELKPGVRVRHRLMGEGEVVRIIGGRVQIRFASGATQFFDGNFLSSLEVL